MTTTTSRHDVQATARRLVERTRAAQGLPPTITDPTALRRIAALMSPRRDEARATTPGHSLNTVQLDANQVGHPDGTP